MIIVIFYYIVGFISCVTLVQDENKNFVTRKPEERRRIAIKKYTPKSKSKFVINETENRINQKSYEVFEDLADDIHVVPFHLQTHNQHNSFVNKTNEQQLREKELDNDEVFDTAESRNYQIKSSHVYEVTEEPENLVEAPRYAPENYHNKKSKIVLIPKPNLYTTAVLKPYAEKYVPSVFLLRPIISINENYKYKPIRVKVLKPYIIPVESSNEYQKPILIKVIKPQNEFVTKKLDSRDFNTKDIENDLYGEDAKNVPKSYQIYKSFEPKTIFKYTVDTLHETDTVKYKKENENKYIYYYNEKPKPWKEYVESNKH